MVQKYHPHPFWLHICLWPVQDKHSVHMPDHDFLFLLYTGSVHPGILPVESAPDILDLTHHILMQFEQMRERLAVIDAPLLFETELDAVCDLTVAVVAPADKRLKRIRLRDDLTEAQARARMAAQQEDSYYTSRAAITLHNDGDLDQLRQQATELAARIREMAR